MKLRIYKGNEKLKLFDAIIALCAPFVLVTILIIIIRIGDNIYHGSVTFHNVFCETQTSLF